jgi:hypothetical protein
MPDVRRYTIFFKSKGKSARCYISAKEIAKNFDGTINTGAIDLLVGAIEGMAFFDVFAVGVRESTGMPYSPRPLNGVWYKSVTLIFQTADVEYYSFRVPVIDETAAFFRADLTVDVTHPSITALVSTILSSPLNFTDVRGVPLVAFVGGFYGVDLTQLQQ